MADSHLPSPEPSSREHLATAKTPSRDLSGRELGDYRLLRRLGQGAMAEVYLAEQKSLERNVAFKVLREDLAHDETYIRRFRLEAQAAASLVHPNIVQVYEVGHVDDVYFMAQEYVAGLNLRQYLKRKGPPNTRRAVKIMQQVAAALAKAGDAGIVHRDIKPDNVMLTSDGEVKVADFGLARKTTEGKAVDLTQVGVTMGTPLYMSPEQVEGRRLDQRSDIYSFGVTCFHMLAGQPPFEGETSLAVAVQHLNKQPPALADVRQDLPDALCQIVHRMLAKQPADRFQSASEIAAALEALARNGDAADTSSAPWTLADTDTGADTATRQLSAVMRRESSAPNVRLRWITFGVAVLVAVLGGGAIAQFTRQSRFLVEPRPGAGQSDDIQELFDQAAMTTSADEAEYWWTELVRSYPDPENWRYLYALQELVIISLERQDNARALQLCDRLTQDAAPGSFVEARAFGEAGRIVVLYQDNQFEAARDELGRFSESNLQDSRLIEWLDYVRKKLIDRGNEQRANDARGHTPTPSQGETTAPAE